MANMEFMEEFFGDEQCATEDTTKMLVKEKVADFLPMNRLKRVPRWVDFDHVDYYLPRPRERIFGESPRTCEISRGLRELDIRSDGEKVLDSLSDAMGHLDLKEKRGPCTLSRLPPEIRNLIFRMCLARDDRGKNPKLLIALRPEGILYKQALEVFNEINFVTLGFHSQGARILSDFVKEEQMPSVRNLVVNVPEPKYCLINNKYPSNDAYTYARYHYLEINLAINLTRLVLVARGLSHLRPVGLFCRDLLKKLKTVELIWINIHEHALVETIENFNATLESKGKLKRVRVEKATPDFPLYEEWFWVLGSLS